ncbi:uncharacterized protein LOC142605991 [Castanea sativa]|uniref:uncharacterized protein LOC142605991 n=1 Tax=Castanea sativa TaxID=21020 RepID=UPI003F64DA5B
MERLSITEECAFAFEDLTQYLDSPPILSRPEKEEVLYAYLAVTDYVVSLVLVRNDDGIQKPVYYVNKSLQDAKMRYLPLEKAVLTIEIRYIGRVAKWGTRLGAYDVKYMPWTPIKGQVLADFMAEFIEDNLKKEEVILTVTAALPINAPPWELGFVATNNEALLARALMVRQLGGEVVELYCDSRLVVGQVNGDFEARDERMQGYLSRVKCALNRFKSFVLKQIPRGQNAHADSLAMLATSLGSKLPRVVLVEDMISSSLVNIPAVGVHSMQVGPSWMDPIVTFLKQGILPEDKTRVEKVRRNAPRYWLSEEQKLYKRSYSSPYLLCVHPEAVEPMLKELHEGISGSHTGGRSLAYRTLT